MRKILFIKNILHSKTGTCRTDKIESKELNKEEQENLKELEKLEKLDKMENAASEDDI